MSFKPKTMTINLMLLDGGVGDHIASLVAVNYILKRYTWIKPYIWMPDYLVSLATNLLPDKALVRSMSQLRGEYNPSKPTKTTKWDGVVSPMKIHLIDYAFMKLCDENPSITEKNYLQLNHDKLKPLTIDLPEHFIVVTTGFTADVREWPAAEINKTCQYIISQGYTPVFLGQTNTKTGTAHTIQGKFKEELDLSVGLNLIDKTTLLEAAQIMDRSEAVLGVDNGLMHVAGCTSAYIIGGFTTVAPIHRMPIRDGILGYHFTAITPDASLDCTYCQSSTNFLYSHDYRNCLYKEKPKKLACTTQMTAEKFINALKAIL